MTLVMLPLKTLIMSVRLVSYAETYAFRFIRTVTKIPCNSSRRSCSTLSILLSAL